jgi:hypothetical protein
LILTNCAKTPEKTEEVPVSPVVSSNAYISNGSSKVAYVLGVANGYADVYIPSADRYATINLTTGAYAPLSELKWRPAYYYYTGLNCTGTCYVSTFLGELGKSIIYDQSAYYKVAAVETSPIATLSQFSTSVSTTTCRNFSTTLPANEYYNVTADTIPYDFSTIAPLTIQYQ